jgi:hypothetical protein
MVRIINKLIRQEELLAETMNAKPDIFGSKWKNGMSLYFLKAQYNLEQGSTSPNKGWKLEQIAEEMNKEEMLCKPKIKKVQTSNGSHFVSTSTFRELEQAILECRSPIFFQKGVPLVSMTQDKKREKIIFNLLNSNVAKPQYWLRKTTNDQGETLYFLPSSNQIPIPPSIRSSFSDRAYSHSLPSPILSLSPETPSVSPLTQRSETRYGESETSDASSAESDESRIITRPSVIIPVKVRCKKCFIDFINPPNYRGSNPICIRCSKARSRSRKSLPDHHRHPPSHDQWLRNRRSYDQKSMRR